MSFTATRFASTFALRASLAALLPTLLLAACAGGNARRLAAGIAPPLLRGEFADDYRGSFAISDSVWFQRPRNRFRIVEWHANEQFLIAQNAPDDPTAPKLWTRIDWLPLSGMAPYEWGFCLTAYQAPSQEAARNTAAAQRSTPLVGCNGFPFTRMKRVAVTSP